MSPFTQLRDPKTYVACSWDLTQDHDARRYWVDFFIRHLETLLGLGADAAIKRGEPIESVRIRVNTCRDEFVRTFVAFSTDPTRSGRVTILTLDMWRDQILRRHGFVDCMIDLKDRENEKVLPMLAEVCREMDGHKGVDQALTAVKGVFAGNLFDMGAKQSAAMFKDGGGPGFLETRSKLQPRPWLIDDFDAFAQRVETKGYRRCVYFVDNAGSDFVLGATVFIRWLAQRGTQVVIAANERPTLNDMTVHDIRRWWPHVLAAEPSLIGLPIEIVSTGTGEPLIDLLEVSDQLNAASADADLVVLEGMGRGVESNLDAEFRCDAMNLAMIKDEMIAKRVGGQVFDCVCRFR